MRGTSRAENNHKFSPQVIAAHSSFVEVIVFPIPSEDMRKLAKNAAKLFNNSSFGENSPE